MQCTAALAVESIWFRQVILKIVKKGLFWLVCETSPIGGRNSQINKHYDNNNNNNNNDDDDDDDDDDNYNDNGKII